MKYYQYLLPLLAGHYSFFASSPLNVKVACDVIYTLLTTRVNLVTHIIAFSNLEC